MNVRRWHPSMGPKTYAVRCDDGTTFEELTYDEAEALRVEFNEDTAPEGHAACLHHKVLLFVGYVEMPMLGADR